MMLLPHPLPDWVKSAATTLIGAVIGFISGFVADALKTHRAERNKREKMRKAVYVEITQHYHAIRMLLDGTESELATRDQIKTKYAELKKRLEKLDLSGGEPEDVKALEELSELIKISDEEISQLEDRWRSTLVQLFRLVPTDCYRYAKSNPDIFYQLREAFAIDAVYLHLQVLLGQIESTDVKRTHEFARSFLCSVDRGVESGALDEEMFKSVGGPLYAQMGGSKKLPSSAPVSENG